MENNRTSFMVPLLLVIIIVGIVAVYYSIKSSSEGNVNTSAIHLTKTYSNPSEGVSIMYPDKILVDDTRPIVSFISSSPVFTITLTKLAIDPTLPVDQILTTTEVDANSGKHPAFSAFAKMTYGGNTFYMIRSELFEGVLDNHYYIVNPKGVYLFDVNSQGVDWTNPQFDPNGDLGNMTARSMFGTFKLQ